MKKYAKIMTIFTLAVMLSVSGMAVAQEAVALKNHEKLKDSNVEGGRFYTFTVPEDTMLLTLWTYSATKGNLLDVYVNDPRESVFPKENSFNFLADRGYGSGCLEEMNWVTPTPGIYRIYVSKIGEGCEFEITARAQSAIELKHDKEFKGEMNLDGANNSKFFYFEVPEGMDRLVIWTTSTLSGDAFDLFLNSPKQSGYPSGGNSWASSTVGYGSGCFEKIYILPNNPPVAGEYRAKLAAKDARCKEYTIQWKAEKVTELVNGETTKFTTREMGEYIKFEVPKNAKSLTVITETIERGDILDLFLNGPLDEKYPNPDACRWSSAKGYGGGGNEKIDVENPRAGTYYIWVSNAQNGKPYFITATYEMEEKKADE